MSNAWMVILTSIGGLVRSVIFWALLVRGGFLLGAEASAGEWAVYGIMWLAFIFLILFAIGLAMRLKSVRPDYVHPTARR